VNDKVWREVVALARERGVDAEKVIAAGKR
jgi:hypothetical protein